MSSWDDLKAKVGAAYVGQPQKLYHVDAAVETVKAGLEALAAHGFKFDLVEHDNAAPQEFPKVKYRLGGAESVVVDSAEDEANLGPGWFNHPNGEAPPVPETGNQLESVVQAKPQPVDIAAAVAANAGVV